MRIPKRKEKSHDQFRHPHLHEVVDGPLVTLLTEAKGDLDTIPIDWAKMGLPGPTIELDKFLNLFDAS